MKPMAGLKNAALDCATLAVRFGATRLIDNVILTP